MAQDCAADPLAIVTTDQAKKMRKSLKFFLMTESIVTVKACNTITIDRSLVLNFFSQAIPFTVMLFTTIKELERKMSR